MLGVYGLFFELSNPGSIVPGVVGGIFIILAFFALQTLATQYRGIAVDPVRYRALHFGGQGDQLWNPHYRRNNSHVFGIHHAF